MIARRHQRSTSHAVRPSPFSLLSRALVLPLGNFIRFCCRLLCLGSLSILSLRSRSPFHLHALRRHARSSPLCTHCCRRCRNFTARPLQITSHSTLRQRAPHLCCSTPRANRRMLWRSSRRRHHHCCAPLAPSSPSPPPVRLRVRHICAHSLY